MDLLLDADNLGLLCHPRRNRPITEWLAVMIENRGRSVQVFVPEITDYELRRKLMHLIRTGKGNVGSIERLEALARRLEY